MARDPPHEECCKSRTHGTRVASRQRREFPPSPSKPKKKKPTTQQHALPSQASTCSTCTTSPAPASSSPAGKEPRLCRGPRASPCMRPLPGQRPRPARVGRGQSLHPAGLGSGGAGKQEVWGSSASPPQALPGSARTISPSGHGHLLHHAGAVPALAQGRKPTYLTQPLGTGFEESRFWEASKTTQLPPFRPGKPSATRGQGAPAATPDPSTQPMPSQGDKWRVT